MRKYLVAYGAWLLGVLTMAAIAAAWYARVEEIGISELASRLAATDDTEATDTETP